MTDVADAAPVTAAECLADLIEHHAEGDTLLRRAIVAELREKELPKAERDQAAAAAVLEKAYAAARDPEREAAALDEEIARNESELAPWRAQMELGDVADRVQARIWVQEYENELAGLQERKDFASAQLLPLRDAVTKARRDLEAANIRLQGAELNATPLLAYYAAGQKTDAYATRFGLALERPLGDKSHPEHDAAVAHMLYLCTVSGFRTEDYASELPNDARAAQRYWDDIYANANPHQPPPSGREIIDALHTEMTVAQANKALSPSHVDDWRGPGEPKVVRDRGYMEVPTLRDMGIR